MRSPPQSRPEAGLRLDSKNALGAGNEGGRVTHTWAEVQLLPNKPQDPGEKLEQGAFLPPGLWCQARVRGPNSCLKPGSWLWVLGQECPRLTTTQAVPESGLPQQGRPSWPAVSGRTGLPLLPEIQDLLFTRAPAAPCRSTPALVDTAHTHLPRLQVVGTGSRAGELC